MDEVYSVLQAKVDLGILEPINQRRIVAFVNHFIEESARLLDVFIQTSERKLLLVNERLYKLEATMTLLENQLNSIPRVEIQVQKQSVENLVINAKAVDPLKPDDTQITEKEETELLQLPENSQISTDVAEEVDPNILRYRKMLQVGVPAQAVKLKMKSEGFDPSLL
ncbi:WASH complex subunit 3-like [Artemia franciscana]